METQGIFRVTVRGRFGELTDEQRRRLTEALDDHHVTRATFTEEGTFTYDASIDAFSLRFEIRIDGDNPEDRAAEHGLDEAETFLRTLGIGHRPLHVSTMDMASVWLTAKRVRRTNLSERS